MEIRSISGAGLRPATLANNRSTAPPEASTVAPKDEVALATPGKMPEPSGQAETTASAGAVTEPVATTPEQQQLNQQLAGHLLTEVGAGEFKRMAQQVPPNLMPAFKVLGEAANRVAQGSAADLYYHLSQNVHHFAVAHDNTVERINHGCEQPKGEILTQEMKVQAEALALLPFASPELLTEVEQESASFRGSASQSADARSVELIKQKLPAEQVAQAMASLPGQPLQVAANPELLGEADFGTALTTMQDVANDFLPVATGLRSLFFRAAQGVAEPPGPEILALANNHGAHFFSQHGPLARISGGLQKFAQGLAEQQPDRLGRYRAANNTSTLLLALDAGSNDFYQAQANSSAAGSRHRYQQAAVQQLVLQQGLLEQANPMLIQAATNPDPSVSLKQQSYTADSAKQKLLEFSQGTRLSHPTQVTGFNDRLIHLLSEKQAGTVLAGLAQHPLAGLDDKDLAQLESDFKLPFAGSQRARASLGAFQQTQTALQSSLLQLHR